MVIVEDVAVNCVITPDEPVIEPDAERLPEVEILPSAVMAPDAKKLLTALEPAVNLPSMAEVELKFVIVPLTPRIVDDAAAPIVTPVTVVMLADAYPRVVPPSVVILAEACVAVVTFMLPPVSVVILAEP